MAKNHDKKDSKKSKNVDNSAMEKQAILKQKEAEKKALLKFQIVTMKEARSLMKKCFDKVKKGDIIPPSNEHLTNAITSLTGAIENKGK